MRPMRVVLIRIARTLLIALINTIVYLLDLERLFLAIEAYKAFLLLF